MAATGESAVRCVEALRSLGHRVVGMMVLVDCDQGVAQRLAGLGIELAALFTLDEVRRAEAGSWSTNRQRARTAASG